MSQEDKIRFSALRKLMGSVFGLDELHDLFMDLRMDPENADGKGKETVIRYLIGECHKQKRFLELLEICARERPAENWAQFEQLATVENDDLLAHPHLPAYKKWVVQQYNVMRLLGMERPLPLDAVYSDVYLLNKNQYWQNLDSDQANARLEAFSRRELGVQGERYSGVAMLEKEKYLFIVGQPGAGKTTFLRWLAVRAAEDKLNLNKIPVLVELRRLNDGQYSLFELIVKEWRDSGFPKALADEHVEQLIRSGDAIVLLDGLDEVRQELRDRVNNQIDDLVKMSGDSHMLITCRPHVEKRRFDTFTYMEMAEFTSEQTNQFIKNWFGNEETKANKLIQELENREQKPIQELTKIPLLLALICITYDQVDELPQKRAELYSQALEVVLSKWDDERGIRRESVYGQLTTERKEELLAYVAYHSFEAGQLFVPQKELEKLTANFWQEWRQEEIARQKEEYGQVFPQELPEREINANQIVSEIIAQYGIFVEQGKDVYSFAHLSFQEYFVARYIVSHARQGTLEQMLTHVTDDQWREVFLLAVSLLDDDADEFFALFGKHLSKMSREHRLLPQLLKWAETKADMAVSAKQVAYRPLALRAWYFARAGDLSLALARAIDLARNLDLAIDRDLDLARFLAHDHDLDRDITRTLDLVRVHDLALDLDLDFARAIDRDFARAIDRAIERDRYLARAIARDLALAFDLDLARAIARDLDLDLARLLARARAIDRDLARDLALDLGLDLGLTDLHAAFVALVIPEVENDDEEWQQFAQSLSAIIEQYRDLSGLAYLQDYSDEDAQAIAAMDWSGEGLVQYDAYIKTTQLLVDCLPLAIVSDRVAIEDQLLLPVEADEEGKLEKE